MDSHSTNSEPANPNDTLSLAKHRSIGLKLLIILIAQLVAVTIGCALYFWNTQASLKRDVAVKNDEIAALKDQNAILKNTLDTIKPTSASFDSEQIGVQKAAQAYLDAQVLDKKYTAQIDKLDSTFAWARIVPAGQSSGSIGGILLKKSDGAWIVIHSGQNGPDNDTIMRFAVPKSIMGN